MEFEFQDVPRHVVPIAGSSRRAHLNLACVQASLRREVRGDSFTMTTYTHHAYEGRVLLLPLRSTSD